MSRTRTNSLFRTVAIGAAILAAAASGVALANPQGHGHRDPQPTYGPVETLTWTPTGLGPDASPVLGDFTTGKHVTYMRFAGTFKTPLHIHSTDYLGIVLVGEGRHYVPGDKRTETILRAGSHWTMPANLPHVSECVSKEPCIFALYQDAKFDFIAK
jgi:quercetin dioxygenase-like cupin family protein